MQQLGKALTAPAPARSGAARRPGDRTAWGGHGCPAAPPGGTAGPGGRDAPIGTGWRRTPATRPRYGPPRSEVPGCRGARQHRRHPPRCCRPRRACRTGSTRHPMPRREGHVAEPARRRGRRCSAGRQNRRLGVRPGVPGAPGSTPRARPVRSRHRGSPSHAAGGRSRQRPPVRGSRPPDETVPGPWPNPPRADVPCPAGHRRSLRAGDGSARGPARCHPARCHLPRPERWSPASRSAVRHSARWCEPHPPTADHDRYPPGRSGRLRTHGRRRVPTSRSRHRKGEHRSRRLPRRTRGLSWSARHPGHEIVPARSWRRSAPTRRSHRARTHRLPQHRLPQHRLPQHRLPQHRAPQHRLPQHRAPQHRAPQHRDAAIPHPEHRPSAVRRHLRNAARSPFPADRSCSAGWPAARHLPAGRSGRSGPVRTRVGPRMVVCGSRRPCESAPCDRPVP